MDDTKADIAVIGLAVMGQNLVLNMNDHGFRVAVFNRTVSKVDDFINNQASGTKVIGAHSLEELVSKLTKPRKIMLMVKAGDAVDDMINQLVPLVEAGDIIIDGGNSNYQDTIRRFNSLKEKSIHYIGCGVSGGEEGARRGPSIMPGGSADAWDEIKPIFTAIAAKGIDNLPCCEWIGSDGAGHFVKMVHNGIEYGDMELIAESYWIMKNVLKLGNDELSKIFEDWNNSELDSYLIKITSEIIRFKDQDGSFVLDKILDNAGQKGTGKWTVMNAAEEGQPLTVIAEAVFARSISSMIELRQKAAAIYSYSAEADTSSINKDEVLNNLKKALYLSKVISYAQGFMLIKSASDKYNWQINLSSIAQMWSGGCIIRSKFLVDIKKAYTDSPDLENLLLNDFFINVAKDGNTSLRQIITLAVNNNLAVPAYSAALSFFDSFKSAKLPTNLLQAQRDYFGAHTYERIDRSRGEYFHTDWSGHGGDTTSGSYNV